MAIDSSEQQSYALPKHTNAYNNKLKQLFYIDF